MKNENITITVNYNELSTIFGVNYSNAVHRIRAKLYSENEDIDDLYVDLTDEDEDNIYSANFTSDVRSRYNLELQIIGSSWGAEILDDVLSLKVKAVPGFKFVAVPLSVLLLSILRLYKRRRRN